MRNIQWHGKTWIVINQFFFEQLETIQNYANRCGNLDIFNDCKNNGGDRFMLSYLKKVRNMSEQSYEVLIQAKYITTKSLKYRNDFHKENPHAHINTWDAGWYQIKKMINQLNICKNEMETFKTLFTVLGDKLQKNIYKLGFLK